MKYKVIFTKQAESDLRGIFEYIAFFLYEPEIAAKQVDHIETAILKLNEMPERFPLFKQEPWHSRGFRNLPVDNFIIIRARRPLSQGIGHIPMSREGMNCSSSEDVLFRPSNSHFAIKIE